MARSKTKVNFKLVNALPDRIRVRIDEGMGRGEYTVFKRKITRIHDYRWFDNHIGTEFVGKVDVKHLSRNILERIVIVSLNEGA